MVIVHLTSSRFFGGPERQIVELARSLRPDVESVIVSFSEGGRCRAFLEEARAAGLAAVEIRHDMPHLLAGWREVVRVLRNHNTALLCCHGYKADVLGLSAARWLGLPVVSVSRGWTGETRRVRLYEVLDRWALRWMDRVICVSQGQADAVRRAGISRAKTTVIANAVRAERFAAPDPIYAQRLCAMFAAPPQVIVGAAGRLSPEKGFDALVEAARRLEAAGTRAGFVLFGDGPLRETLANQIRRHGLQRSFILAGFHADFDRYLPHLDVLVLPSHTEGLPNVVLEAFAAGVSVVATAVGGTPELVQDGVSGYLVAPGDVESLARRIGELLDNADSRRQMGSRGREHVGRQFTFPRQAAQYRQLLADFQPRRIAEGKDACIVS